MLIIAASLVAVINWRKAALFKMDNEELREQLQALQVEVETAARLSEISKANSAKAHQQTTELMQLRNEVTQLRAERSVTKASQAQRENPSTEAIENRNERGNSPAEAALPVEDVFPRERWTFAGYATPESALVSAIWAMNEGTPEAYLNSLAPTEQERIAKLWQDKSEAEISEKHRNQVSSIRAFAIAERKNIAPGELLMTVGISSAEGSRTEQIRMQQVGQEWKFGGFIRDPQPVQSPPQIPP